MINGVLASRGGNGGFTSTTLKEGDVVTNRILFYGKCVVGEQAVSNSLSPHIIPGVYPLVSIAADDPDLCSAGSKNYTATVQNAGDKPQYQWMVNGQTAGTNAAIFNAASLSTGDKLTCMVTGRNSCGTGSKVSNELVIPQTVPSIDNSVTISSSLKNNVITEGQQITFTALAAYTTGISYQWLVNGLSVGTNSATFVSTDLTNGDVVTCQVTTTGQCVVKPVVTSNALTVLMLTPIVIPNAFTPNGDGVNDTWDIKALLAYVGCTIDVYNRYGMQVYHTLNYTSGWDGSAKGKRLPAGTYYYLINPNDGTGKLSGPVTILR
jgi:gliding motility-associated-like protein